MAPLLLLLALGLSASPAHAGSPDEVEALWTAGRTAEALDAARQGVAEAPGELARHELLIDLLMTMGLGTTAQHAYARYAQDNPGDAAAWTLYGRAAVDAESARTAYAKALEIDGRYARAHMGLAAVDRAEGSAAAAEDRYRLALQLDPSLGEAWAGLGGLLIGQERMDEALVVVQQAVANVPDDPDAWLALAALEPSRARPHLEQAVQQVDDDPRVWHALAREQMDDGDVREARQSLERVRQLAPDSAQVYLDLVLVSELEAGHIDILGQAELDRARSLVDQSPVAAELALDDLVERYPECFLVFLARGHLFAQQDLTPQAEQDLRRALELSPDSPDVQGALGMLLLEDGQPAQAEPLLVAAYEQRAGDVTLGIAAGMARVNAQGVAPGIKLLAQVAEAHPTDLRPVMALVGVLSQAERTDAAYTVLNRAVARYPHPTLYLSLAAAARDLDKPEEAAAALRELERLTGEEKYGRMADELYVR